MGNSLQEINKKTNSKELNLSGLNFGTLTAALTELSIPRLFYQLVIFIIDGSNSMKNTSINKIPKAEEVNNGIKSIIQRLQSSKNNNSFDISFFVFSDDYKRVFSRLNVKEIDMNQSFNPLEFISSGGTKLNDVLISVKKEVVDYHAQNSDKNCQVLIQILSDGSIQDYEESLSTIEEIKEIENTHIACQFLESFIEEGQKWYSYNERTGELDYDDEWTIEEVRESEEKIANRFEKFASSSELFVTSIDPEEIRKHMIKSISTVSKID